MGTRRIPIISKLHTIPKDYNDCLHVIAYTVDVYTASTDEMEELLEAYANAHTWNRVLNRKYGDKEQ